MQSPSLTKLALSLLLAGPAVAETWNIVYNHQTWNSAWGHWVNDFGQSWRIDNFNDGCRTPYVSSVKWFCIDWNNQRGHFDTDWDEKRCMKMISSSGPDWGGFVESTWTNTPCNWRIAASELAPGSQENANTTAAAEAETSKRTLPNSAKFKLKE